MAESSLGNDDEASDGRQNAGMQGGRDPSRVKCTNMGVYSRISREDRSAFYFFSCFHSKI